MSKNKKPKVQNVELPMKWNWGYSKLEPDLEELRRQNPNIKVKPILHSIMPKKLVIWYFIILLLIFLFSWWISWKFL